ncbi:MAG: hypothetical protein E7015_03605 [Alphaproteobacteria bacterium]|nr:hypothetical protein [Alphaproteobacteria bacterium]
MRKIISSLMFTLGVASGSEVKTVPSESKEPVRNKSVDSLSSQRNNGDPARRPHSFPSEASGLQKCLF